MSVTMLSIVLVVSTVSTMSPSTLMDARHRSAAMRMRADPECTADGETPVEDALPAQAAEGETRSVLRSLRRIGEQPASQPASVPQRDRVVIEPRPLPVAPALQPLRSVPAPIWPSARFLSRPAPVESVTHSSPEVRSATHAGRPHLTLSCQAPEAVDLGAQVRYRLVIRNTGDGVAEQVVVEPQTLTGRASRASAVKRFPVGDVPPGESREVVLRDLARRAESLHVRFFATDLNGSEAAAEARVAVRRPAIEISLHGPSQLQLGERAVFEIHAANAGSGAAEPVRVVCSVGDGLRLTVLDQQVQFVRQPGEMTWAIGRLAAGETKVLRLRARPATAGEHVIRVAVESASDDVGRVPRPAAAEKTVTVRDGANDRTAGWRPSQSLLPTRG